MSITLTDNSVRTFQYQDVKALRPIAGKSIEQLCNENSNLLIFPDVIKNTRDKVEELPIFNFGIADDPEQIKLETGNAMGFIGIDNLKIKIKSRFDQGRDDYLLHYMLQRVLSFNMFDLNHNNEQEDVFDFIMFMFPFFLKNAVRQGLYREYQTYKHNDANVKGPIDIARHIVRNMPFIGRIAYTTREYSYDNNMTELIRHTIEFMKTKKYGQAVLKMDSETIENVGTIIEHTPLYNKNERNGIISKNLRMKIHPYYTEYRPLQTLCLQILRMEEIKYGDSDDLITGILFDGAWLWEEYINTVLPVGALIHAENKKGLSGKPIFLFNGRQGPRYPDFYKKGDIVLDAKYKKLGNYERVSEVNRDDVHQVITYMHILKAKKGGFIAPLENKQENVPTSQLWESDESMSIYGIEICKHAKTYSEFCEQMKKNEQTFVRSLKLESYSGNEL